MLVRPDEIVVGAEGREIVGEILRHAGSLVPFPDRSLEGAEEPLNPAVLSRAVERGSLVPYSEQPEPEAEEP